MANAVFLNQALDGLTASVSHLGDAIKQRDLAIANLNEKLAEKDQSIERLQADLEAAEALIHEKDTQLTEGSDAALNDLAVKIDQLNDAIAKLSTPVELQPVAEPTLEPAYEVVAPEQPEVVEPEMTEEEEV
jgi:chromosome segregation ATPase